MRGTPSRQRPLIAAAILGIALIGACSLNPQPLPPESNGGSLPMAGSGSSSSGGSGSSSGGGLASSSGGASSSSGSSGGANTGSLSDAQVIVAPDASFESGDAGAAIDAAPDTGLPSDGGTDGVSPDAALEDASPGDNGCLRALDCYASHPGACTVCMWPLNYAVCVEHQCRCACDARDAAGDE